MDSGSAYDNPSHSQEDDDTENVDHDGRKYAIPRAEEDGFAQEEHALPPRLIPAVRLALLLREKRVLRFAASSRCIIRVRSVQAKALQIRFGILRHF